MRERKARILLLILLLIILVLSIKLCQKTISIKQIPEIRLYLSQENRVIKLPLEEYIIGTVAAEMPANFHLEALKAQAVCARTYTLQKIISQKKYPGQADVSDDIYSCQAYISLAEFQERNPRNYKTLWNKVSKAVKNTSGLIMVYKGTPIDALYHSTCGGRTESARDVWGRDIPYLQSVKCDYCQASNKYRTNQIIAIEELRGQFGVGTGKDLSIVVTERTTSNRVKTMAINGRTISGESFRKSFNLPSTYWEFSSSQGRLIVNSRGYGHGIGLCQWGANGLAQTGADYREILEHYYRSFDYYQLQWEAE